jgi:hypothetical protein
MLQFAKFHGEINPRFGTPKWKKLEEAAVILGLEWQGDAHDAAADSKMTVQVIKAMADEG